MKRGVLAIAILLFCATAASALWKMNPFTGKMDYYESGMSATVPTVPATGIYMFLSSGGSLTWASAMNFDMRQNHLQVREDINSGGTYTNEIGYNATTRRMLASYGSGTDSFVPATTLTDTKYCIYNSASLSLVCNSDAGSGTVTSVSSANAEIVVSYPTVTPQLTLGGTLTGKTLSSPTLTGTIITNFTGTSLVQVNSGGELAAVTTVSFSTLQLPNGTASAPTSTGGVYYNSTTKTPTIGDGAAALIIPTILTGETGTFGGSLIISAGTCSTGTATVTGATVSMVATAQPADGAIDAGIYTKAYVSGANTVTVDMCAAIAAVTPTSRRFYVRVMR